ncbi:MAG: helix-turn-helix domain-containing protein [Flavobacteriaceae bacterium]|nr:helix-turn-helix domain-containing protein [Flavobacteriaceae bacterium]
MKTATKKKVQKSVKQRNKYTTEHKENARKYYLMGLNLHEISKLIDDCPVRTLEKWQQSDKWTELKQPESIKFRTLELHESGKSYSEIAEILKISRVTVWRYIKEARQTNEA